MPEYYSSKSPMFDKAMKYVAEVEEDLKIAMESFAEHDTKEDPQFQQYLIDNIMQKRVQLAQVYALLSISERVGRLDETISDKSF